MRKAALFRFGTEANTGFPVNVPVGQQDLYSIKRIGTVDNAFLVMGLRFGYLGLSCFFVWCAGVVTIWIRISASSSTTPGLKAFSAAMAGVSMTMLATLLTVWMSRDFGFWYIRIAGASSGLNAGLSRGQSSRIFTVRDGETSRA
ncbi:MAG: hypothetical protein JWP89_6938 [Schlesneria sp.]|nr:hypothetical protein [Schlesneria sp.]